MHFWGLASSLPSHLILLGCCLVTSVALLRDTLFQLFLHQCPQEDDTWGFPCPTVSVGDADTGEEVPPSSSSSGGFRPRGFGLGAFGEWLAPLPALLTLAIRPR